MKNQEFLNNYFENIWSGRINQYSFSGYALVKKVQQDEWVLDVGCGSNPFKGKIKNLVGIDPANDAADIRTTIEDYVTDQKFDVAFCLGSLNFGSEDDIMLQLIKVNSLLHKKAKIYWRCNPGKQDHGNNECKEIVFFPWSADWHFKFAKTLGFTVNCIELDNGRLYSEWVRE